MSTNFYWKKLPAWFNEHAENLTLSKDSIFMHIGKRCNAGLYCHTCGTTLHKFGTEEIHGQHNPNMDLIVNEITNPTNDEAVRQQIMNEYNSYWYNKCPCCGKIPNYESSFTWTLMIHKRIIQMNRYNPELLIVDEYGEEFSCLKFINQCFTPVEFQCASEFS